MLPFVTGEKNNRLRLWLSEVMELTNVFVASPESLRMLVSFTMRSMLFDVDFVVDLILLRTALTGDWSNSMALIGGSRSKR